MRSAAGVFERSTLLALPTCTSTFSFLRSSHQVYQPVCLQARSSLLLYIPVCLPTRRSSDTNGSRQVHERWDRRASPSCGGRLRRYVEFGLYRRESWHARGRYTDAHGLEVPPRCGAAASGRPPAPAAMAWPEGDSRAGRGGATRPGRIPDGSGRGGGVRRQCGYHGPHRGPPTPHGRGPCWSRVGRVCWQAAVGRTGSWHRRGRAGGWRRRTGCRGAALGLRHALWWDGGPGCGHAGGAERVPPKERSPDQRGGADGRCARDTVRRKRVVVRRDGTVLGRVGACRRIALLGCCGLVRRLLHLRGYGFYWLNLKLSSVARVSSLIYLTPPTTLVWAYLMFGERVGLLDVIGLVICFGGVLLTRG